MSVGLTEMFKEAPRDRVLPLCGGKRRWTQGCRYSWPVAFAQHLLGPPVNLCELHCRPEDDYFAEKLRDAVIDGTPCYDGNGSRDICINGICKVRLGLGECDFGTLQRCAELLAVEKPVASPPGEDKSC